MSKLNRRTDLPGVSGTTFRIPFNENHFIRSKGVEILRPTIQYKFDFLGLSTRIEDKRLILHVRFSDTKNEVDMVVGKTSEQYYIQKLLK